MTNLCAFTNVFIKEKRQRIKSQKNYEAGIIMRNGSEEVGHANQIRIRTDIKNQCSIQNHLPVSMDLNGQQNPYEIQLVNKDIITSDEHSKR